MFCWGRISDFDVPLHEPLWWLCWCCFYLTHLVLRGGKRCSRIARHLCLHVKGCDVSVTCVWLTHGFEGGVFVESNCAVVAVRVWKPLSKWPKGWVVQVVLFWCERTRASTIYTWMNNATRLHFTNKSDAMLLFHQWWCGCHLSSSN